MDRVASSIVTHAGFPELVTKDKSLLEFSRKIAKMLCLNRMRLSMRTNYMGHHFVMERAMQIVRVLIENVGNGAKNNSQLLFFDVRLAHIC